MTAVLPKDDTFGLRGFFVDGFDLFITVLLEEAHEETA